MFTVITKFRGRYEATRIEAESAAKAAYIVARRPSVLANGIFVGCFSDHEIANRTTKKICDNNNEIVSVLFEEETSNHSNRIHFVTTSLDINNEESILEDIFIRLDNRRRITRVVIGKTLPPISLEAFDVHDVRASIFIEKD